MMKVYTQTLTFGAFGVRTISDLAKNQWKAARLFVQPVDGNTADSAVVDLNVTDASIPANTTVLHELRPPDDTLPDEIDSFEVVDQKGENLIDLRSYGFSGAAGDRLVATIHVA